MMILIAGCGYLGRQVALRLLGQGCRVLGVTRSGETAAALEAEGIACRAGDLGDAAWVAALPKVDAVVHCAASGRGGGAEAYRRVYVEGCRHLLAAQPWARMVFASSTSVYAQADGSWVTEESPAEPDRETGRLLREAEESVLSASGTVLRLAGLYGPGRSVLLKNFLQGAARIDVRTEPPATPEGRWVNQIHRDDAAAALVRSVIAPLPGIFNVADDTPMTQRDIYTRLATRFARPLPPEAPPALDRKRGWTHKRVSAATLRATGWTPRFPSWFHALDHDSELIPSVLAQAE